MDTNGAKELARRYYEEVLNNRQDHLLEGLFSEEFVIHPPDGSSLPLGAFKASLQRIRAVFRDYRVTVEDQVAESDRVATRWTASGRHEGAFLGIAPTGREVTVSGIHIDRFAEGKIVERWEQIDMAGLLQQLRAAD